MAERMEERTESCFIPILALKKEEKNYSTHIVFVC